MDKQTKKLYEAPALTAVSFKAERGFALSTLNADFGLWDGDNRHNIDENSDPAMDNYDEEFDPVTGGYWNW